jgi:hypothetical protein
MPVCVYIKFVFQRRGRHQSLAPGLQEDSHRQQLVCAINIINQAYAGQLNCNTTRIIINHAFAGPLNCYTQLRTLLVLCDRSDIPKP